MLLQKHKGRLSGSLDVTSRGAMDRMMSTPLAAKERGITHRISKDRADFWKEDENRPKDKKDNHKGMFTNCCCTCWATQVRASRIHNWKRALMQRLRQCH